MSRSISTYDAKISVAPNADGTFTLTVSIPGAWGTVHKISRTAPTVADAWAAAADFGDKLQRWATRTYPDIDADV